MARTRSLLVFACYDRSCAPPPTGTGGSKAGKAGSTGSGSVYGSEESYRDALHQSALIQRGAPEGAMLTLQKAGGGVFPHAAEHIGDLTHRINEMGGRLGSEFVKPKVDRQLDSLTSRYGFKREMMEQIEENFRGRSGSSSSTHKPYTFEEVKDLGQKYADEHRKVPVYNRPSELARDAAISLGEMRFQDTVKHLTALKVIVDNPSTYSYEMSLEGARNWKAGNPTPSARERIQSSRSFRDAISNLERVLN